LWHLLISLSLLFDPVKIGHLDEMGDEPRVLDASARLAHPAEICRNLAQHQADHLADYLSNFEIRKVK
jgi:hypothetical protein